MEVMHYEYREIVLAQRFRWGPADFNRMPVTQRDRYFRAAGAMYRREARKAQGEDA